MTTPKNDQIGGVCHPKKIRCHSWAVLRIKHPKKMSGQAQAAWNKK